MLTTRPPKPSYMHVSSIALLRRMWSGGSGKDGDGIFMKNSEKFEKLITSNVHTLMNIIVK